MKLMTFAISLAIVILCIISGFDSGVSGEKPQTGVAKMSVYTGLQDVGLFTPNVEKMAAFYDALGLPKVIDEKLLKVYSFGGQDIAIHVSDISPNGAGFISILVSNLERVQKTLKEKGLVFQGPKPLHAGYTGIELTDPDGNKVNLLQER